MKIADLRLRRASVALVLCVLFGGCAGFTERREHADYLIGTPQRLHDAKTARVVVTTTFKPKDVIDPTIQTYAFTAPLRGVIDLETRQVSLATDRGDALVYDKDRLYIRDLDDPQVDRPFVHVDLSGMDADDIESPIVGFNLVSPVVWTELMAGALSGSVHRGRTAKRNGVEVTRYRANVDRAKSFTEYLDGRLDENALADVEEIFRIIGMTAFVTPAEAWLDHDGLPRKLVYRAEQRVDRHNTFALTLTYELSDFGKPIDVKVPATDETVGVDSIRQLLAETGIEGLARAGASAPPAP